MYPNRCKRPQESEVVAKEAAPRGSTITSIPAAADVAVTPTAETAELPDLEAGDRDHDATVKEDHAAAVASAPPVLKRIDILDSIVPSAAGKVGDEKPLTVVVAQKDETETGTVVKVDSGTALALAAQVAALEAKLQASEDEKQALHLQLTKFESRLIASEEERKAVELSEQKLRNASEMQQRLTCERGLRSQLATVREGPA